MNILLINYEFPPIGGGGATASWYLAREMVKLGHRAVVLTSGFGQHHGRSIEDGVAVYRLRDFRRSPDRSNSLEKLTFVIAASAAVFPIVKRKHIDRIVVFFSLPCGPVALLSHLAQGTPYVVSLQGGDVPGNEPCLTFVHLLLRPLRRAVLRHAAAVVANSSGLKVASEKADPFRVAVIPNGVDAEFFAPPSTHNHRYNADKPFGFLFAGRFQPQKNLTFLLDQMARLRRCSNRPFSLHLVGDGPLRARLALHAHDLKLHDIITWHPWCSREELRQHFWSAHCFVNLSTYEGMANAVLEAMACGLPVIASKVPGNEDVVKDGESGRLVDISGGDTFVEAALAYLRDPALALRHGMAARIFVVRHHSWHESARAYVSLLNKASS